ncbi:MAG TPA: nucleotidyltransferase family protein [Acidimicrobiales bacterium]|jgi:hypothetical protein|nr:nucleotidyltransferase family protein [Acidimicrobiales bacterium]
MVDGVRARLIGAAVTMAVDQVTEEVVAAFDRARVASLLLKGPSIAQWLYPEGGRIYRDTDLLVSPDDFGRASDVLRSVGFGAPSHALVDHAHTYQRDMSGYAQTVDLHRTLPYFASPPAEVWRVLSHSKSTITLGDVDVDVLGAPERCLHTAVHAVQHAFEVLEASGPFEDLRRAIAAGTFEEWSEAAAVSRALGAEDALAAGLCLLPEGETLCARLGLTTDRRGIVRIAATVGHNELPAYQLQRFIDAGSFSERVRLLVNPVMLSPANLRQVSPLARRGRMGLGLAYAARPFVVGGRVGSALVSRRRILKP